MCSSNNNAATQLRGQQQQQQAYTNSAVNQINQAFQGYTPQFYNNYGQNYMNWALPQLGQQYQQTAQQLGANLSNRGLSKSSAAQNEYNQLQNANSLNQQGIASTAQGMQNQLQQQVGQEQAGLIQQAEQSTNPMQVAQGATAAAANFGTPSAFQPLGNLFGNFSQLYLGNQLQNTYNPSTQQLLSYLGNYQGGF